MSKLTFHTPTTLDEAFIFTMGASVKTGSNPIGFFGTGLKYAIAVTLRLGGQFKIETNECTYRFDVRAEQLRNTFINMIYCTKLGKDGAIDLSKSMRCPMTTDYGKTWKPWMVMRELYSNTIDEGGEVYEGDAPAQKVSLDINTLNLTVSKVTGEWTKITVEQPDVFDAWIMRDKYILNKRRTPIYADAHIEIYPGSCDTFFYRGISVGTGNVKTGATYNLLTMPYQMTEDRTAQIESLKYNLMWRMACCKDEGVLKHFFDNVTGENVVENDLVFTSYDIKHECSPEYGAHAIKCVKDWPATSPQRLKEQVYTYLKEQDIEHAYKPIKLTEDEQKKADECLAILDKAGMSFKDVKLYWSNDMAAMAISSMSKRAVVVNSDLTLNKTDWKRVTCMTLIEEWVHQDSGAPDESRQMQEAYNKLIYQLIVGERG